MIRHFVALHLRADASASMLAGIMSDLSGLVGVIDGFTGFEHGPNRDAEGKSPDHTYGFICQMRDRAALDRYAADPRHRALGQALVALCQGGGAGIIVYDIDVTP